MTIELLLALTVALGGLFVSLGMLTLIAHVFAEVFVSYYYGSLETLGMILLSVGFGFFGLIILGVSVYELWILIGGLLWA